MVARRQRQFVNGQLAWMLVTVVVLSLLDALTIEIFFIGSLLGLLVMVELTAPINVAPAWRARLKWVVAVGILLFGYFMVRRILEFLPEGFL